MPVTSDKAVAYRRVFEFWCVNCLTKVGGYGGGSRVRHEKLTCAQSRKLPHTRARILAAWKRLEGRADVSGVLVHVQASEWVRRLVEDGDIERQPGPSRHSLSCACVQTAGVKGCWTLLREASSRFDVCCCRRLDSETTVGRLRLFLLYKRDWDGHLEARTTFPCAGGMRP